jgi:hypothetical protein
MSDYRRGFGLDEWMTGFIDTLFTQLGTAGKYSAIAILHTFSSPLHTHWGSQSSQAVSWQRIYNSLSLQITHEVFAQSNSFFCHFFAVISKIRPNSRQLLPPRNFPLCSLGVDSRKTPSYIVPYCFRRVYLSVAYQ